MNELFLGKRDIFREFSSLEPIPKNAKRESTKGTPLLERKEGPFSSWEGQL
jgi:hypothetical protein